MDFSLQLKLHLFTYPSVLTCVLGAQKNRDGSFEYPQHMFWLRNKKNNFPVHTLIWRPGLCTDLPEPLLLTYRNYGCR